MSTSARPGTTASSSASTRGETARPARAAGRAESGRRWRIKVKAGRCDDLRSPDSSVSASQNGQAIPEGAATRGHCGSKAKVLVLVRTCGSGPLPTRLYHVPRGRGANKREGTRQVTASTSLTAGAAGRYATALFELALDGGLLDQVEADLGALQGALAESADLAEVIKNPLYTREQQGDAMAALGDKMGLSSLVKNVVGLMATKRRLFALPQMITGFQALLADHRGEVTAEVTSAKPMSDAQIAALKDQIKASVGRDVKLNVTVDERIIGGLIVKVGSKMIDSSIRSRLNALQNVMREAG